MHHPIPTSILAGMVLASGIAAPALAFSPGGGAPPSHHSKASSSTGAQNGPFSTGTTAPSTGNDPGSHSSPSARTSNSPSNVLGQAPAASTPVSGTPTIPPAASLQPPTSKVPSLSGKHHGGIFSPGGQGLTGLWNALQKQAAAVQQEEVAYQLVVTHAKTALGLNSSVTGAVYVTQSVYGAGTGVLGTLGPSDAVLVSGLNTALAALKDASTPQAALQALTQAEQDVAGLRTALSHVQAASGNVKARLRERLKESERTVRALEQRVHKDRLAASSALHQAGEGGRSARSAREALLRYAGGLHALRAALQKSMGQLSALLKQLG